MYTLSGPGDILHRQPREGYMVTDAHPFGGCLFEDAGLQSWTKEPSLHHYPYWQPLKKVNELSINVLVCVSLFSIAVKNTRFWQLL